MVNNPRIFHLGESLNKLPELRENNGKAKRKQSYSSAVTANYYESSTHKKPRETWLQGYACCKHSLFIVRQKITDIKSLSRRRIRDWFQFIVWLNNNHNIIFRISYKASSCEVVWKETEVSWNSRVQLIFALITLSLTIFCKSLYFFFFFNFRYVQYQSIF